MAKGGDGQDVVWWGRLERVTLVQAGGSGFAVPSPVLRLLTQESHWSQGYHYCPLKPPHFPWQNCRRYYFRRHYFRWHYFPRHYFQRNNFRRNLQYHKCHGIRRIRHTCRYNPHKPLLQVLEMNNILLEIYVCPIYIRNGQWGGYGEYYLSRSHTVQRAHLSSPRYKSWHFAEYAVLHNLAEFRPWRRPTLSPFVYLATSEHRRLTTRHRIGSTSPWSRHPPEDLVRRETWVVARFRLPTCFRQRLKVREAFRQSSDRTGLEVHKKSPNWLTGFRYYSPWLPRQNLQKKTWIWMSNCTRCTLTPGFFKVD